MIAQLVVRQRLVESSHEEANARIVDLGRFTTGGEVTPCVPFERPVVG